MSVSVPLKQFLILQLLLILQWIFDAITHIVEVNHESNVASNSGTELSLTGGQPDASWWSGTTHLPPGRVHIPASLLTVIGQNLPIPLKHKVKSVIIPYHILIEYCMSYILIQFSINVCTSVFCGNGHQSYCNFGMVLSTKLHQEKAHFFTKDLLIIFLFFIYVFGAVTQQPRIYLHFFQC